MSEFFEASSAENSIYLHSDKFDVSQNVLQQRQFLPTVKISY